MVRYMKRMIRLYQKRLIERFPTSTLKEVVKGWFWRGNDTVKTERRWQFLRNYNETCLISFKHDIKKKRENTISICVQQWLNRVNTVRRPKIKLVTDVNDFWCWLQQIKVLTNPHLITAEISLLLSQCCCWKTI